LVDRLEHLSVDSIYAHRASGVRGSLLRFIGRIEAGEQLKKEDQSRLGELTHNGFELIELAAREIGGQRK